MQDSFNFRLYGVGDHKVGQGWQGRGIVDRGKTGGWERVSLTIKGWPISFIRVNEDLVVDDTKRTGAPITGHWGPMVDVTWYFLVWPGTGGLSEGQKVSVVTPGSGYEREPFGTGCTLVEVPVTWFGPQFGLDGLESVTWIRETRERGKNFTYIFMSVVFWKSLISSVTYTSRTVCPLWVMYINNINLL